MKLNLNDKMTSEDIRQYANTNPIKMNELYAFEICRCGEFKADRDGDCLTATVVNTCLMCVKFDPEPQHA